MGRKDHLNNIMIPNPSSSLIGFSRNITSQFGEDGIIERVLELIKDHNGWCVEFGSWDGKHCSNTFNLIHNKSYSAVLIEGDPDRFLDLSNAYADNKKVIPINAFVGFDQANSLDVLLTRTRVPVDFDLLSIDIDGNDYHVWQKLENYKPKIVIIEYNPTIPNTVEFVQKRDMRVAHGSSLLSITKLANVKSYELVCVTEANAIFVDSEYFDLFEIVDNSLEALRKDESLVTHLFCGYDGTVFVRGCGRLPWQKLSYKESKMQQLPKWLRHAPGNESRLKKKLGRLYRKLRERDLI